MYKDANVLDYMYDDHTMIHQRMIEIEKILRKWYHVQMVKEYLDFVESMPLIDTSERSEYIKGVLMEDFKRNITFDFMMEMIWLASNQVASACHIASGEGSNFWIDFYPIFKDMYLTPMIKFW